MPKSACYWILQVFVKSAQRNKQDFAVKVGGTYQVQGYEDPVFICGIRGECEGSMRK